MKIVNCLIELIMLGLVLLTISACTSKNIINPSTESNNNTLSAENHISSSVNSSLTSNISDDIYTSMKNGCTVKVSGFSANQISLTPKNTNDTILKIIDFLKKSTPYIGTIPKSTGGNSVTSGNIGPKYLIIDTNDDHHIGIEPTCYYVHTESQGGNEQYTNINFVTNVLRVDIDSKTFYITSKNLYNWIQDDQWESEFNQINTQSQVVSHVISITQSKTNISSVISSTQKQVVTQEINTLSNLKTPDKIIYYYGGKQKVFTKDDQKFQNIINLNTQRNQSKLEMLESAMMLENISQASNMLVYEYEQSGYASIYFQLNKSSDGKYTIAQPATPEAFAAQQYGFLSAPDQLIDYLNS